mgnify:CR=1 FL=1
MTGSAADVGFVTVTVYVTRSPTAADVLFAVKVNVGAGTASVGAVDVLVGAADVAGAVVDGMIVGVWLEVVAVSAGDEVAVVATAVEADAVGVAEVADAVGGTEGVSGTATARSAVPSHALASRVAATADRRNAGRPGRITYPQVRRCSINEQGDAHSSARGLRKGLMRTQWVAIQKVFVR